jgi:hypothetical protein
MMKKNIVDFRGKRNKTKDLSKSAKFKLFAEIRMPKLLRSMKSVRNLANQDYYSYDTEQKRKIMADFKRGYKEMLSAWDKAGAKKNISNEKKSYWDN